MDALACPRCSSETRTVPMTVLAFLIDPDVVAKILRHLGLPISAPVLAVARAPQHELGFPLAGEAGSAAGEGDDHPDLRALSDRSSPCP